MVSINYLCCIELDLSLSHKKTALSNIHIIVLQRVAY
jgi:hypothetical protein